jgi:hypothetical protein
LGRSSLMEASLSQDFIEQYHLQIKPAGIKAFDCFFLLKTKP